MKAYYVLYGIDHNWGPLSFVFELFQQVLFAEDHGLTVVFDTKYNKMPLIDANCDNPFYGYFQPIPGELTIDEVYQLPEELRVIGAPVGGYIDLFKDYYIDYKNLDWISDPFLEKICPIFKKYFTFSDAILNIANKWQAELFPESGKIIGVNIRCCYKYVSMCREEIYGMHPRIFDADTLYSILMERLKDWGYEFIYLICDDREYLEKMEQLLGERLIYVERPVFHYFENDKPVLDDNKVNVEFLNSYNPTTEYLAQVELLGRCDSIIYTPNSAATYNLFRRGINYEFVDVYDLGRYQRSDFE